MPSPRKPKAWNLKPQLTAAPELWGGSRYFVVPFWGGSQSAVITNTNTGGFFSSSGSPSNRETIKGRSRYYGGTSFDFDLGSGFFDNVTKLTIACYFIQQSSELNQDEGVFGNGAQVEWDDGRAVQLVSSSGGDGARKLRPRFFVNTPSETLALAAGNNNDIVLGEPSAMVGTWSASSGLAKLYFNGRLLDSVAGPTSALAEGYGDFIVASYYDHETRRIDADFLLCVALDDEWSDKDAKKWMADPFAMLRPAGF